MWREQDFPGIAGAGKQGKPQLVLVSAQRKAPYLQKYLIVSDTTSCCDRLRLPPCYKTNTHQVLQQQNKEEIVNIVFVSLTDIRVGITDFTPFPLNLQTNTKSFLLQQGNSLTALHPAPSATHWSAILCYYSWYDSPRVCTKREAFLFLLILKIINAILGLGENL